MSTANAALVIGLGNRDRGDDAAGLVVAERLRELGHEALVWEGPEVDLVEAWRGRDHVVLVDAGRSGHEPGTTRRLAGGAAGAAATVAHPGATHAFDLGTVVELARRLGQLPPRVDLYVVEAGDCTAGADLSPAVEAAVGSLVAALCDGCGPTGDRGLPTGRGGGHRGDGSTGR